MTEEVKQEGNTEVVLSEAEIQAKEQGWVPKDEFNGEEHSWVDAGEFLRRGQLFKKIEDQNKQLKDVRFALNEMKKLHANVRETEYKRALDSLREQKITALEEGDAKTVIAVEEKMDLVKQHQIALGKEITAIPEPELHPEFTAWTDRNTWYERFPAMRGYADALGRELASQGIKPAEVLKQVEVEVRKEFPNRFKNPNQEKANNVEGDGGNKSSGSSKGFQLPADERRVMQSFIRNGVMTESEYIKAYKEKFGV